MLPYPQYATTLIEVPTEILTVHGGRFGPGELREVVERHIGHGVYPAIKVYSEADPIISDYTVDSTTIKIAFPSYPGSYNVRVSDSENGLFAQDNDYPFADTDTGNIYVMEDLASNTVYWIYVAFVDSDGNEHLPGTIGPKTDNATFTPRPYKLGIRTYPVLRDPDGVPVPGPGAGVPVP